MAVPSPVLLLIALVHTTIFNGLHSPILPFDQFHSGRGDRRHFLQRKCAFSVSLVFDESVSIS